MQLKPLLVAFVLTASTSAHADPVRATSGSGFVSLDHVFGTGERELRFDLFVDHLHLTGGNARDQPETLDVIAVPPDQLLEGAVANLSSTSTLNFGFGSVNDKPVVWNGQLSFITPDTLLRDSTFLGGDCNGELFTACEAVAPFQFDGLLHALEFDSDGHLHNLADFRIRGQGQASALMFKESEFFFPDESLSYDFSQTDLTPEPSSVLLVGSILLVGAVRRWRTRTRSTAIARCT